MSHAIGAAEFDGAGPLEGSSPARRARFANIPWRSGARCLLLAMVLGAVGHVAFRPGLIRLSVLLSLVSPSRGESLAWKPEGEDELRLAPVKFTPPPGEWRLSAVHSSGRLGGRPGIAAADAWQGGRVDAGSWRRESFNPWAWPDDAGRAVRRDEDPGHAPVQKPASPFRAQNAGGWAPASGTAGSGTGAATSAPNDAAPGRVPSLAPLSPLPDAIQAAPERENEVAAAPAPAEAPALPAAATQPPENAPAPEPGRIVSEALSLSDLPVLTIPDAPRPAQASAPAPLPAAGAAPGTISPSEALSASFSDSRPVDWREREITGPIPGAYLTIYPGLNFVGLCVPGQGYIRKYNQVAVPSNPAGGKLRADDGLTPYGKYYVAAHVRDAAGPRVVLSWPSVEDARRGGGSAGLLADIERAWSSRELPPQDSAAGGGLSLSGDRAAVDRTAGGFSLEAPHMEEVFTALPDGAWVFVQQ